VKYATEHRCGVVVRGGGLSDAISGTDPLKDNLPLLKVEPLDESAEASSAVNGRSNMRREALLLPARPACHSTTRIDRPVCWGSTAHTWCSVCVSYIMGSS
jgi:hypothetical protein